MLSVQTTDASVQGCCFALSSVSEGDRCGSCLGKLGKLCLLVVLHAGNDVNMSQATIPHYLVGLLLRRHFTTAVDLDAEADACEDQRQVGIAERGKACQRWIRYQNETVEVHLFWAGRHWSSGHTLPAAE